MKITREETAPREVSLNIELEPSDLEPYLDRAYKRLVNRIQIPGFRPGKAPRFIVENHVGREALVRESLDLMAQESLDKAITEENLEIFGEPDVEVEGIDPPSFKAVVPLEPIVDLGPFRNLRLEPEPVEVTEEQVGGVIDQLRYDTTPWEPVNRPINFGDLVTLNVQGFIEGRRVTNDKGVDFIPNQDNSIPFPGFSVYLEGMEKAESKEFTLQIPEDYQDSTVAGKDCRFNVEVMEIKGKVLPELDDEFAKGVGDGYDSLEGLRASIRENLTNQVEKANQRAFQERVLEGLVQEASIEVSQLTTNREVDHMLEEQAQAIKGRRMDMDAYLRSVGKSREDLRDEIRPSAEGRLNRVLVLRKLAKEEGIEVSPEEIDAEVENLASASGESRESVMQALSSENARSSMGNSILTKKVLERLAQIVQGGVEEEETPQDPQEGDPTSTQGEQASAEVEGAEESATTSPEPTESEKSQD